jgi:hypothetical protein
MHIVERSSGVCRIAARVIRQPEGGRHRPNIKVGVDSMAYFIEVLTNVSQATPIHLRLDAINEYRLELNAPTL